MRSRHKLRLVNEDVTCDYYITNAYNICAGDLVQIDEGESYIDVSRVDNSKDYVELYSNIVSMKDGMYDLHTITHTSIVIIKIKSLGRSLRSL